MPAGACAAAGVLLGRAGFGKPAGFPAVLASVFKAAGVMRTIACTARKPARRAWAFAGVLGVPAGEDGTPAFLDLALARSDAADGLLGVRKGWPVGLTGLPVGLHLLAGVARLAGVPLATAGLATWADGAGTAGASVGVEELVVPGLGCCTASTGSGTLAAVVPLPA